MLISASVVVFLLSEFTPDTVFASLPPDTTPLCRAISRPAVLCPQKSL